MIPYFLTIFQHNSLQYLYTVCQRCLRDSVPLFKEDPFLAVQEVASCMCVVIILMKVSTEITVLLVDESLIERGQAINANVQSLQSHNH
jgi:hypothetical protein